MSFIMKDRAIWLYLAIIFFLMPASLLMLILTDRQTILERAAIIWLVLCGCYVVLISALAIANLPEGTRNRFPPPLVQTLVRILGSIVWGGLITAIYFFAYWLIFSRENLSPQ